MQRGVQHSIIDCIAVDSVSAASSVSPVRLDNPVCLVEVQLDGRNELTRCRSARR